MDIHEAYAIYQRITCEYASLDLVPEIFTDDIVGGNASFGRIHGLEAQTIFLGSARRTGLEPEDHLSCMVDGTDLAFRARNWAGKKHASPFFDVIGHLIFDADRGKFCFYYGFYDPTAAAKILGSSAAISLDAAATAIEEAKAATARFLETREHPALPDRLRVASD